MNRRDTEIEIEEYKGQTIYYDTDYDKFVCDISIEDQAKSAKRGSLKDLRREIDQFIKLNLNFKPFKFLNKDYRDPELFEATGIRTDGKLLVCRAADKGKYGYSQYGAKDAKEHMFQADPGIVEGLRILKQQEEKFHKDQHDIREKLIKKLVPLDVSKYDLK